MNEREIVPHPFYGDRSVPSGFQVPLEVIRSWYVYDRPPVFPESAIPADVSLQRPAHRQRPCYVDVLKQCHTCDRSFFFFAREQQHWFETLRFYVGTECLHCPECRRSAHRRRAAIGRYSRAAAKDTLSDTELEILAADCVLLFRDGVLRNEQKLRRIKNLARARIPETNAARSLMRLIEELETQRSV